MTAGEDLRDGLHQATLETGRLVTLIRGNDEYELLASDPYGTTKALSGSGLRPNKPGSVFVPALGAPVTPQLADELEIDERIWKVVSITTHAMSGVVSGWALGVADIGEAL
jgi:hypothetical protein